MCATCLCADRFGLGWAHDAFCFACHLFMHFPCICTFFSIYLILLMLLGTFLIVFLSLPLSLFTLVVPMAPKRKSTPVWNPLPFVASSSSDPSPSNVRFYDDDAFKVISENFSRRGIHSECQVVLSNFADTDLPSVIHSRGWESLCDVPVTCPLVFIQEFYSNMYGIDRFVPLFFTRAWGMRIPVTLQLVVDVLRVLGIEFPDYHGCEHLRTVSRDELMFAFYERPTTWGERLFTPCRPFAKGPRFMNMVMTCVLHPLFHYNSIIEPRARFLLSLLEYCTIDFLLISFFLL